MSCESSQRIARGIDARSRSNILATLTGLLSTCARAPRYGSRIVTVDLTYPEATIEMPPARLLDRIRDVWHPAEVWLFGRRAQNRARPDSDWDLLRVVSDVTPDALLDLCAAWTAVRDLKIAADIIPVRRAEFEEARTQCGTLAQIVATEGRRIDAR